MTLFQAFGQFAGQAAADSPYGLTHLNTTTFSAVISVSIDNVFSDTYENYRFVTNFATSSATLEDIYMRLRASGSDDSTGSSYVYQTAFAATTTVGGARYTDDKGGFSQSVNVQNTHMNGYFISPYLSKKTAYGSLLGHAEGSQIAWVGFTGTHTTAASYDGFTFFTGTGSLTMTGSISIYGMGKAAA